jgi:hypothetical protein
MRLAARRGKRRIERIDITRQIISFPGAHQIINLEINRKQAIEMVSSSRMRKQPYINTSSMSTVASQ